MSYTSMKAGSILPCHVAFLTTLHLWKGPSQSYPSGLARVSHSGAMIYCSHLLWICFIAFQLPFKFHGREEKGKASFPFFLKGPPCIGDQTACFSHRPDPRPLCQRNVGLSAGISYIFVGKYVEVIE